MCVHIIVRRNDIDAVIGGVADNSVQQLIERAEPNLTAMVIPQLTGSLFDSIVLVRVVDMVHVNLMRAREPYEKVRSLMQISLFPSLLFIIVIIIIIIINFLFAAIIIIIIIEQILYERFSHRFTTNNDMSVRKVDLGDDELNNGR